jgi:two-component system, OmpR family, phosphate regulon sensor histidine kinase PhoR
MEGRAVIDTVNNAGTPKARTDRPIVEAPAAFLASLLEALSTSNSPSELAPHIASAAIDTIGDCCGVWLSDRRGDSGALAAVADRNPTRQQTISSCRGLWLTSDASSSPDWAALLKGPVVVQLEDAQEAAQLLGSPERVVRIRELGLRHLVIAPMIAVSRRLGFIAIGSDSSECPFSRSSTGMVAAMARAAASAIVPLRRAEVARQAAQQLTLSGLRFQAILEALPQGVLVVDAPDGRVATANHSFQRLAGQYIAPGTTVASYPDLLGVVRGGGGLARHEDIPWIRCAATGVSSDAEEMVINRPDGQVLTVLCSTSPILDEGGKVIGAVALLHDISARKELELQKDEFLAMVAHELKTPLTSVKGYVQLLMRQAQKNPNATLGEKEVGMLQVADRQVTRLGQLVFDLLDCSSIQLGRLVLRLTRFDLGRLAEEIVAQMQAGAPEREINFQCAGNTTVEADPQRMEQVLTNLIANAVKATEHGGRIDVSVHRDGPRVVASVRDDGMGISMDLQQRVFERLFRGPAHRYEGMGLGLYISKGIMDAHGGTIWLESREGEGSSFFFALQSQQP